MQMNKRILCLVLSICSLQASFAADYSSQVDENCELVSTVCRLAGFEEYANPVATRYVAEVEAAFRPYEGHAIIRFLTERRASRDLSYDAMMQYACFTEIVNDSIKVKDCTSFERLVDSDPRWTVEDAERFTELLNAFYLTSGYHEFFSAHLADYHLAEEWVNTYIVPKVDYDWFTDFFGVDKLANLRVIPSLLNKGNYGIPIDNPRTGDYFPHIIVGPIGTDSLGHPTYYKNGGIILHEFTHSFVNPALDSYKDTLSLLCRPYCDYSLEALKRREYEADPYTQMVETLVRMCNAVYSRDHAASEERLRRLIAGGASSGFPLSETVYDALVHDYLPNRAIYPTLDDYIPRLIEIISTTDPAEIIDALPQGQ